MSPLSLLTLLSILHLLSSKLLTVQMLSRHGIRAPKASLASICPAYNNWDNYDVEPEALTGLGMMNMHKLGKDVRNRYIVETSFLPKTYQYRNIYVRSSDSPRCMQSASSFGSGIYPDGTGPKQYLTNRPTIVPVHTEREADDALLDSRKGHCKKKVKQDSKIWSQKHGRLLYLENLDLVDVISDICKTNLTSLVSYEKISESVIKHRKSKDSNKIKKDATQVVKVKGGENDGESALSFFQHDHDYKGDFPTAIKDIADALIFDQLQGLPMIEGLDYGILNEIHQLSFKMFYSRYFDDPDKIVYMSGGLPRRFSENFEHFLASNRKQARLMYSYHTHRDMMYSFAEYFHIQFAGPGVVHVPGVPQGFIPPSTSLFFELYEPSKKDLNQELYISVFLWLPCNSTTCPFTAVPMGDCGLKCPYSNFLKIIEEREEKNGDWRKMCKRVSRETLHKNLDHYEFLAQSCLCLLIALLLFDNSITKYLIGDECNLYLKIINKKYN